MFCMINRCRLISGVRTSSGDLHSYVSRSVQLALEIECPKTPTHRGQQLATSEWAMPPVELSSPYRPLSTHHSMASLQQLSFTYEVAWCSQNVQYFWSLHPSFGYTRTPNVIIIILSRTASFQTHSTTHALVHVRSNAHVHVEYLYENRRIYICSKHKQP